MIKWVIFSSWPLLQKRQILSSMGIGAPCFSYLPLLILNLCIPSLNWQIAFLYSGHVMVTMATEYTDMETIPCFTCLPSLMIIEQRVFIQSEILHVIASPISPRPMTPRDCDPREWSPLFETSERRNCYPCRFSVGIVTPNGLQGKVGGPPFHFAWPAARSASSLPLFLPQLIVLSWGGVGHQ